MLGHIDDGQIFAHHPGILLCWALVSTNLSNTPLWTELSWHAPCEESVTGINVRKQSLGGEK